ncbi:hypothetical protein D9758_003036 [Tetrapyrgos nigripes]|uniref:Uncharacterized protein n=1 Tax=Tetrapyrgos nigripes TaxID=182062 RepID=A0A8H5GPV9_9AGAR|nr:hypothetical protein D9758_003036 [Tetrapyrgos nigripes]
MSPVTHEASSSIVQGALAWLLSHPASAASASFLVLLVVLLRRRYPCLTLPALEKSFKRLEDAIQTYQGECPQHYYHEFHDGFLILRGDVRSLMYTYFYGHWDPVWTLRYWKSRMDHIREVVACYERCEDMHRSIQHAIEIYRQRQDSLLLGFYNHTEASAYSV